MKVTFTHHAAENERFAPHAFDGRIGKVFQFNAANKTLDVGPDVGYLTAAVVSDDGYSVELSITVPDPVTGEDWYEDGFAMFPLRRFKGEGGKA